MTNRHRYNRHPSLGNIERKLNIMAEKLDEIQTAETAESAAVDTAVAGIKTLLDKLAAIPTSDPTTQAAIDALTADMTVKTKELTDAVAQIAPAPAPAPLPPVV